MKKFISNYSYVLIGACIIFFAIGFILHYMGRLPFGPDGKFALWEGDIWSQFQSQRLTDPYSFTHFVHGILFFAILAPFKKIPVRYRFLMAILLEGTWEVLENSPIIINRYRSVTIALGYEGDSILNSLSDIVFAGLGFIFAFKTKVKYTIATVVVMELFLLLWIKDNLTLNLIMLIYPIEAIKIWQAAGQI